MKEFIKKSLPVPVLNLLRESVDATKRLIDLPDAYFHSWRRQSRRELAKFHNKHSGERCFIIGNGPSLKQTDLTKLKNEFTFGMNRLYMAYETMGFQTTYYVTVNDLVIEQCADDILQLNQPRLFPGVEVASGFNHKKISISYIPLIPVQNLQKIFATDYGKALR